MPRYRYQCTNCGDESVMLHSYDEVPNLDCNVCMTENSLKKLMGTLYFQTKEYSDKKQSTGQLTKEYIEENRKILEEEKRKARNETYEPS